MNDIDPMLERVKAFVELMRWKYDFPLTMETRIEEDLKITGDDSVEFIVAFGKEFNVDVSKFMLADYFKGEGGDLIEQVIGLFTKTKPRVKKVIRIKHLLKAAELGKLDEESIKETQ